MQEEPDNVIPEDEPAVEQAPAISADAGVGAEPAVDPAGAPVLAEAPVPAEVPAPAPHATLADATLAEAVGGGVSWVPFAVYLGAWVALSALSAYLLQGATADQPARWLPEYAALLWAGVGLAATGPVLSLAVWLAARAGRPRGHRRGLFASAMTRGALAALFGVIIWVATLYILEIMTMNGAL